MIKLDTFPSIISAALLLLLCMPTDSLAENRQSAHPRIGLSTYIGDTHNVIADELGLFRKHGLEGKTLALTRGAAAEYFLHAMAFYYGIDTSQIRLVHATMDNMQKTLESGTIDAFLAWEPNIGRNRAATTVPTTIMPDAQFYKTNWLALVRREFARDNKPLLERYLRVLLDAEGYLRAYPEAASRIHARRVGMPEAMAIRLHQRMTVDMPLNERLLLNFRDQAGWANQVKHGGQKTIPGPSTSKIH